MERKTNTSHQVLPARIRPQVVEQGRREFNEAEHPLPIRLLQLFENRGQVTHAHMNDGDVKRGNVCLVGKRLDSVEDFESLDLLARQGIGSAEQCQEEWTPTEADGLFEVRDGMR